MAEAGVSGTVIHGSWYGMFAPPNTPTAVTDRLFADARAAIGQPQVREKFSATGLEPDPASPAEFKAFLERVIREYAEAVRAAGIEPQ
jgi:tripartite-type tricarboxylate transporter receptor subunit TctC